LKRCDYSLGLIADAVFGERHLAAADRLPQRASQSL
jgi:hypothetical protein